MLGGLLFGSGGVVNLAGISEFGEIASEIGVILLLLMLGLEYTARELVTGLKGSWLAGVVDLVLNFTPGAALALIMGWGFTGALVLGGVTYVSSSGIIAKVLSDLGRLGNRETPVVLSILVLEDLAMAVYLPVLTATLAGLGFLGGLRAVGIALAAITVVLLAALRFGPQISRLIHSSDRENFLLKLIGAALLVAGLASALQVSAAVGAFMLGIAISGSTAHSATKVLEPLRDLFAAMFFVVFGLNTDPTDHSRGVADGHPAGGRHLVDQDRHRHLGRQRAGIGVPGRIRAGMALIARGEFSIVIAGLAVASGAVTGELAALATAYVLLLAVFGPIAARLSAPLSKPFLPKTLPSTDTAL